jgi:MFS family permease
MHALPPPRRIPPATSRLDLTSELPTLAPPVVAPEPMAPAAPALLHSRAIERSPIYYGWVVLAAGTLGMAMTMPGRTHAIAVVVDPIMADAGVSRGLASALFMIGTLVASFLMTPFGAWLDRQGPRRAVALVCLLFGLSCFQMAWVSGPATLLLAILTLRGFGQGALNAVSQHVIGQWFVRRRGLAMGVAGVGVAIANTIFPIALAAGIAAYGWREAYMVMGLLTFCLMLPVGAAFYRHRPELYGLVPDGHAVPGKPAVPVKEVNWTREAALRTRAFWVFAFGDLLSAGLGSGLLFHHFSIMAANGLSRLEAAALFLPLGLVTALFNILAGVALDRVNPRYVLTTALGCLMAALMLAGLAHNPAGVLAYGVMLGATIGIASSVNGVALPHYFGRRNLGSIKGVAQTCFIAGTAMGPIPFAVAYELGWGYWPAILGSMALTAALGVAALLLRPLPPPPDEQAPT